MCDFAFFPRWLRNLVLGVLFAVMLAACQKQTATVTPTATVEVREPVGIIWYVRENAVEQAWQQDFVIPAFEEAYPDIKVNLVVAPWADFDTRMNWMIDAGAPPDVWSHWGPSGFQNYVRRGLVADLTNWVEKDEYDLSDFEPTALEAYRVNGRLMGLPMYTTGSFVFYNKDLFDTAQVPYPPVDWDDRSWTWSAFLERCEALTNTTGDPVTDVFGCNLDLWPSNAYALLWGKDFYPYTAYQTGFTGETYLDAPLVIEAFDARQDLVWKDGFMPNPIQQSAMQVEDLFRSQRVAMRLTGGYGWWQYADISEFRWAVAALPFGAEGRRDILFTDPWMLSSQSRHPEEAWTFLKFLASLEVQESWMDLTGAPPVRKSLEETWYKRFPNMTPEEVRTVHQGALKYGLESPHHLIVEFPRVNDLINQSLEQVLKNQKKASEVLPELKPRLEAMLKQIQDEYTSE